MEEAQKKVFYMKREDVNLEEENESLATGPGQVFHQQSKYHHGFQLLQKMVSHFF